MRKSRTLFLLVVVAHWVVAMWHLFLATKVLPAPNNKVSWLAVILITLGHLLVSLAIWKLSNGVGKTMIGKNICHAAVLAGYSVLFRTAPALLGGRMSYEMISAAKTDLTPSTSLARNAFAKRSIKSRIAASSSALFSLIAGIFGIALPHKFYI
jgi:hypothetical protein